MSSTTVETTAKRIWGSEAMARPYTTSFAPDTRYPPGHPAHDSHQYHGQPPRDARFPPQPSQVPGVPENRGPSHISISSPHGKITSHIYGPDMPAGPSHISYPPPEQPPCHQYLPTSAGRPRHDQRRLTRPSQVTSPSAPSANALTRSFQYIQDPSQDPDTQLSPRTLVNRLSQSAPSFPNDSRTDNRQPLQPPPTRPLASSSTSTANPPSETRSDPMRISDILSDESGPGSSTSTISPKISKRPSGLDADYKLNIRQQPVAARSCGFGERDRRVIDPPPIVQLLIESPYLNEEEIRARLRYNHYVMNCSIYDETGTRDAALMPEEYRQQRRLMGSLVGAPFVGKDEFGEEGCFFCFPDLSCRTPGAFRLKFSLVMIDPVRARDVRHFPVLVEVKSDVFTVYSAKDFPGMQASTRLTKRLKEQGCIISIKKGNDKSKSLRVCEDSSDGEQDEAGPSSQSKKQRRSNQRQ